MRNKLKGILLKWNLESRPPPGPRFPEQPPGKIDFLRSEVFFEKF